MRPVLFCGMIVGLLSFAIVTHAADKPKKDDAKTVAARVESSLKTAGSDIRQFAMDGDEKTFFLSNTNPTNDDQFTVVLTKPVRISSVKIRTGKPDGDNKLEAGQLECSADGKKFEKLATFAAGACQSKPKGQRRRAMLQVGGKFPYVDNLRRHRKQILALRIKPTGDATHALAIAEISIESTPAIAKFIYPVEISVDVSDAPEMQVWADKMVRVCEEQYPMLNEQLKSPGYKPATQISMVIKNDYKGVAATSGNHIVGAVKWFKDHPEDIGAMVHETTHVVQRYRSRGNPGWLVEGLCDYVRFFHYEPPGHLGRIDATRSHYNGSYRITAAFLDYCQTKYDKELVLKLNEAMRNGHYDEAMWEKLTGKKVTDLDDEWRATLKK